MSLSVIINLSSQEAHRLCAVAKTLGMCPAALAKSCFRGALTEIETQLSERSTDTECKGHGQLESHPTGLTPETSVLPNDLDTGTRSK